jgi:hypothetical protein
MLGAVGGLIATGSSQDRAFIRLSLSFKLPRPGSKQLSLQGAASMAMNVLQAAER